MTKKVTFPAGTEVKYPSGVRTYVVVHTVFVDDDEYVALVHTKEGNPIRYPGFARPENLVKVPYVPKVGDLVENKYDGLGKILCLFTAGGHARALLIDEDETFWIDRVDGLSPAAK